MRYVESYKHLAEFGKQLLEHSAVNEGMELIRKYLKETVGVERSSVFVLDRQSNELWTIVADDSIRIRIPADAGVVGRCVAAAEAQFSNDAYHDKDFFPAVDAIVGFMTHNLAVVPIYDASGEVMGALEVLNKATPFDENDLKFMKFFCGYISSYLGLALLFDEAD